MGKVTENEWKGENPKMISRVYVDASGFISLRLDDDSNHAKALKCAEYLINNKIKTITSNIAIYETVTVIAQKVGLDEGRRVLKSIRDYAMEIVYIDEYLEDFAIKRFMTIKSKNISLFDCVHFAVMEERGIKTVFGFDAHFKKEGFSLLSEKVILLDG